MGAYQYIASACGCVCVCAHVRVCECTHIMHMKYTCTFTCKQMHTHIIDVRVCIRVRVYV